MLLLDLAQTSLGVSLARSGHSTVVFGPETLLKPRPPSPNSNQERDEEHKAPAAPATAIHSQASITFLLDHPWTALDGGAAHEVFVGSLDLAGDRGHLSASRSQPWTVRRRKSSQCSATSSANARLLEVNVRHVLRLYVTGLRRKPAQ